MTGSNRAEAPHAPWHLHADAADEARRLICARFAACNRADSVAMRALVHVPHVSLPGPRLTIRRESDSAGVRLRRLRAADDWHHSLLERLDIHGCSEEKVHCAIAFGKNAADGRRYADAEAVYVVTRRAGRWGIVLSSVTLRPIGVGADDHAGEVALTANLFQRWLAARDAGDPAEMRQLVHLPFVELRGQQLVVHRSPAALRRDVARRPDAPAWQRRELGRIEARERSANKVTLEADVARVGPRGTIAGREAVLVIAVELQGRWALQVYSAI